MKYKKPKAKSIKVTEPDQPVDVENEIVEVTETTSTGILNHGKPVVPLKVFLNIFGKKWDQMAGFKHYAKKQCLGPLTVKEWREAFQSFMDRPTA